VKTTRDDDVRALAAMALVAAAPLLTLLCSAGLQIPLLLS